MNKCFITRTGSFLPGDPVNNDNMHRFIGTLNDEAEIKRQVLAMNGIRQRHYALDESQVATHDVYQMAELAIKSCINGSALSRPITYLSAGSTYTPFSGPGMSSILHGMLGDDIGRHTLEVNSNSGICTSSATALFNAYRAIQTGDHRSALCVGSEFPSDVLKSTFIAPERDEEMIATNLKKSNWFMSVFLRFMLSDGAGAFLLQDQPDPDRTSFEINWAFSRSFAHEAPLCMKLENSKTALSQDVSILSKFLFVCAKKFVAAAMEQYQESLDDVRAVLPHMSSFFFKRKMERVMRAFTTNPDQEVPYWTNLATAGNTGAASIFIMLDEFVRTQSLDDGDRVMLFIPESGQFNFVLFNLTVHKKSE